MTHYFARSQAAGAAIVAASRSWSPRNSRPATQPQQPQQPSSRRSRSRATPARCRIAVPDLLALSNDRETQEAARVIGRGAVGRPELRARVLHDSARHLQDRFRRRRRSTPCRTIAGASSAPTAWSLGRCRRWRPASASRCGSTTCGRASRCSAASTRARRPTRGSTRTPCPTNSTSRSASCAAWRAPS